MTTTTFDRVYIWERPVRLYHWMTVVAILTLIASGLLIGHPLAFLTSGDASASQWFGTVRFLHFAAGYVAIFALLIRLYWMFMGNRYARWNNFLPISAAQFKEALQVVKVDLFQIDIRPMYVKGHNAAAAWTYALFFLLTLFQAATGLGLYAPMSTWWLPQLFTWVVPLMGGDANVRLWHHAASWVFILFVVIHLYLSVYHDWVEGNGELSSMVSGAKFLPRQ